MHYDNVSYHVRSLQYTVMIRLEYTTQMFLMDAQLNRENKFYNNIKYM